MEGVRWWRPFALPGSGSPVANHRALGGFMFQGRLVKGFYDNQLVVAKEAKTRVEFHRPAPETKDESISKG